MEDEEIEKLANDGIWQNATYQVNVKSLPDNSTFKKYKWASSDEAILTVSQEGLLTGIGEGTATVTVTADDFNSNPVVYSFSVKVKKAVEITDFSFLTEGADVELLSELGYGQEIDLNSIQIIEFTPGDATSNLLQWSSSDDKVVSVTEEGLLKVNTTTGGSVEITAIRSAKALHLGALSQAISLPCSSRRMAEQLSIWELRTEVSTEVTLYLYAMEALRPR